MSKRVSAVCLFAAWLCASGAVLDGVQVFAWGRMFVAYAHQLPVQQAVAETMDGSKPCALCQALQRVREQSRREQPAAAAGAEATKLDLIAEETATSVIAVEREPWPAVVAVRPPSRVKPVLLPPPREVATARAA